MAYDAVGNRIGETRAGARRRRLLRTSQGIFDNLNRLTSLEDVASSRSGPRAATTFGWDPNGNQIAKTVGTGPTATTTSYRYDLRDKLVEVGQGTVATPDTHPEPLPVRLRRPPNSEDR